jgi:formylglycine-generating enzyme required for sulfatase activity
VIRGGYWENDAKHCRSAIRANGDPGNGGFNTGFRVLLAPGQ